MTLILLSIGLCLIAGWAWSHKPKASPENKERYIRLLNPRPFPQGQPQPVAMGVPVEMEPVTGVPVETEPVELQSSETQPLINRSEESPV